MQANQEDWLGGLSYLRNLVRAVMANPDRRLQPVLIAHPAVSESLLAGFDEVQIVRSPLAYRKHPARLAGEVGRYLIGRDLTLEKLLQKHRIDALSHSFPTGARSPIPSIGWIPDFQHVRMQQLFSRREKRVRDADFGQLIEGSRTVILSSYDARRDFASFAPGAVEKTRVLHFVSAFSQTGAALTPAQLQARFAFDRPFFHLPNQFWAHKNHALVIEALGILKRRGKRALVLATGRQKDHRHPGHFDRLMARVKALGLEDYFRALGVVSLPELHALMLNAIALINPSNFEGWSTTVEESKSLGIRIVLSDIPVHVEQAPPLGSFFEANSAESLADAMLAILANHDPVAATAARESAAHALPARVRQFGRHYENIALDAIAG